MSQSSVDCHANVFNYTLYYLFSFLFYPLINFLLFSCFYCLQPKCLKVNPLFWIQIDCAGSWSSHSHNLGGKRSGGVNSGSRERSGSGSSACIHRERSGGVAGGSRERSGGGCASFHSEAGKEAVVVVAPLSTVKEVASSGSSSDSSSSGSI